MNKVIPVFTFVVLSLGLFGNISIGEVNIEDRDITNDDKQYTLATPEASAFVL